MATTDKYLVELRSEDSSDESILGQDSRWALAQRVAGSCILSRANQLRAILLYLVRNAIVQPDELIHESEIAHRVLGRRMDFNPLDDNIVRVQMAHLRKKLDLYFSTEGKDEDVTISVALGTYKPIFSSRTQEAASSPQALESAFNARALRCEGGLAEELPSVPREPGSERASGLRYRARAVALPIAAVVAILALVACVALWVQNRTMETSMVSMQRTIYPWKYSPSLALFWSGFLESPHSTDVVMSDAFFKLAGEMSKRSFTLDDYLSRSFAQQLIAEQNSKEARDVLSKVSTWRSANANHLNLARRILFMDPQGTKVHLYFARDYRPDLIQQDNVILLGSRITNPWDELFDGRLNFAVTPGGNSMTVITNRAPAAGERASYSRSYSVGYCVVAYMPNPGNNGKVLLIEGTSVEATEAGGDFLLSEEHMTRLAKRLGVARFPYFELLLKTSQVSGTPFNATVEAYRTYPNLH